MFAMFVYILVFRLPSESTKQAMKSKRDESKTMLSLPLEILNNILSRLPAKGLGHCKCVCKYYNSLISEEEFVKLHLNRANSDTYQSRIFTVYPFYFFNFESEYAYEDGNNDDSNEALAELSFSPDQQPEVDPPENSVDFVGSCNSLICLCTPNSFVLWNPTIKESREIPGPTSLSNNHDLKIFGFGYSPSGDDYKLVICVSRKYSRTSIVEVFDLKVGSWTGIEHELGDVIVDDTRRVGTYLNGALHWEVTHGVEPHVSNSFILINIMGEKYEFGEILEPKVADASVRFRNFGIMEGRISLLSDEKCDKLGIWVMKEYGVRESWSRIAPLNLFNFSYCCYAEPVCYAKNGEVVIDIDGISLVRYNIKERSSRGLKSGNGGGPHFMYAILVESLISPNSSYPTKKRI